MKRRYRDRKPKGIYSDTGAKFVEWNKEFDLRHPSAALDCEKLKLRARGLPIIGRPRKGRDKCVDGY